MLGSVCIGCVCVCSYGIVVSVCVYVCDRVRLCYHAMIRLCDR